MKKTIEMQNRLMELKKEAQDFLDGGKVLDAQSKMEEIKELKAAIEMQTQLDKEEEDDLKAATTSKMKAANKEDAIKNFAAAARNGFQNAMSEGSNEDGGYTVPEDISTQIQILRESADALEPYITVEPVSTLSGARTFKKRTQQTGFAKVSEGGKIAGKSTPQFTRMEYKVEKYAGYFPVTNELLEDSDTNIVSTLTKWIGDESRVTRNLLILEKINTVARVDLKNLDGIKKAINVTLNKAFRKTAKIFTNQDGLQYFDTLKDSDGKYLLQPMVTDQTRNILFGIEVVVIGNDTFASDLSVAKKRTIPVVIGDLKEAIVMYDRKVLNVKSSDVAMNAFEEDLTLFRAIEREDVRLRDELALLNGTITIDDDSVVVSSK